MSSYELCSSAGIFEGAIHAAVASGITYTTLFGPFRIRLSCRLFGAHAAFKDSSPKRDAS